MHRIFDLPKLYTLIIEYAMAIPYEDTVALPSWKSRSESLNMALALGLTCERFFPIAMNRVWEYLPSLVPIIHLLPDDIWTIQERLARAVTGSDLARFNFYASRVKRLCLIPSGHRENHLEELIPEARRQDGIPYNLYDAETLVSLASYENSCPIFPALEHFEAYSLGNQEYVTSCIALLSPSLKKISFEYTAVWVDFTVAYGSEGRFSDIRFSEARFSEARRFIRAVRSKCTRLEHIQVASHGGENMRQGNPEVVRFELIRTAESEDANIWQGNEDLVQLALSPTLKKLDAAWEEEHSLRCFISNPELAALCHSNIEELRMVASDTHVPLWFQGTEDDVDSGMVPVRKPTWLFPNLKGLDLVFTDVGRFGTKVFLRCLTSQHLCNVRISAMDPDFGVPELTTMMETVVQALNPNSLSEFCIEHFKTDPKSYTSHRQDKPHAPRSILDSFSSRFPLIRRFEIGFPFFFDAIDNEFLENVGSAWPKLEVFALLGLYSPTAPTVTGLDSLLEQCPNLHTVTMQINANKLTKSRSSSEHKVWPNMRSLILRGAIEDSNEIGHWLTGSFPKLEWLYYGGWWSCEQTMWSWKEAFELYAKSRGLSVDDLRPEGIPWWDTEHGEKIQLLQWRGVEWWPNGGTSRTLGELGETAAEISK
ncbi:hypothetical protein NA57DRAFT_69955 [Rhizodiscina lignyota]|uniref:Uncharacterized protein n=1 Tax=Rhizodiscina lignyota TaxID=1504668 RepID=A0A9P4ILI6_9PEZI|nr:hypothetical protein NA57DRAFT_69955 [Rhizodiscina lignyota]